jgi:hypothetical protein
VRVGKFRHHRSVAELVRTAIAAVSEITEGRGP